MALNAYLTVKGRTQGDIRGSVTTAGREDFIEVWGWHHEFIKGYRPEDGVPFSKRQHKPITITKPIDQATPALQLAMANQEILSKVELRCWRPTETGAEEQFFTITLRDAHIVSIRQEQLNNKYVENLAHEIREHISFTYRKIAWTFQPGSQSADDDWAAP